MGNSNEKPKNVQPINKYNAEFQIAEIDKALQQKKFENMGQYEKEGEKMRRYRSSLLIVQHGKSKDQVAALALSEAKKQRKELLNDGVLGMAGYHGKWEQMNSNPLSMNQKHVHKKKQMNHNNPSLIQQQKQKQKQMSLQQAKNSCEQVERPQPMEVSNTKTIVADANVPFINTGLLIRIDNPSSLKTAKGHGFCTATILEDKQTLLTAGHCVGRKEINVKGDGFEFKIFDDKKQLRFCPGFGKKGSGDISIKEFEDCPIVTEAYILDGWWQQLPSAEKLGDDIIYLKFWDENREDLKKLNDLDNIDKKQQELIDNVKTEMNIIEQKRFQKNKHFNQYKEELSERLEFDIAILRLGTPLKDYKPYEEHKLDVTGLPYQYVQELDIQQLYSPTIINPLTESHNYAFHTVQYDEKEFVELTSTPLFTQESGHKLYYATGGYPVDSNDQLILWRGIIDKKERICMYGMNGMRIKQKQYKGWKDNMIVFPMKTNHGASGGPLVARFKEPNNKWRYSVIGVLSGGERVEGNSRTNFRIITEQIAGAIEAVKIGAVKKWNAKLTDNKNTGYRLVGFRFKDKSSGYTKGTEKIAGLFAKQQYDNSYYYENYEDYADYGNYGDVNLIDGVRGFSKVDDGGNTNSDGQEWQGIEYYDNYQYEPNSFNMNGDLIMIYTLGGLILFCCIFGVSCLASTVLSYICFSKTVQKREKQSLSEETESIDDDQHLL